MININIYKDILLVTEMNIKLVLFFAIVFLLGMVIAVELQAVDVAPSNGHATLTIPSNAVEIAPGIFSLGIALDNGRIVEGYAFIDYKKENSHKLQHGGNGGSSCFSFLAKGAKWKTIESWVVNPLNSANLDNNFVFNNIALDISKWETGAGKDILGDGSVTNETLFADSSSPDNKNEILFGDVESAGAIAVTIVWGIFSGPPFARELVEWDMVYDDVDFAWSMNGESGKMDFENIATHEIGHAAGMGHPSDSCTEETMYRFADFGETKKRDLNNGDTDGIKKLYS